MSEIINVEVLTQLLRAIPGAVWSARVSLVTGTMAWIYLDSKTADLHDLTEAELRANPGGTTQRVLPEDRARIDGLLAESLQTLSPVVWSGRVLCRSGELRWIESHITFLRESDETLLMFGQVVDVTERMLCWPGGTSARNVGWDGEFRRLRRWVSSHRPDTPTGGFSSPSARLGSWRRMGTFGPSSSSTASRSKTPAKISFWGPWKINRTSP